MPYFRIKTDFMQKYLRNFPVSAYFLGVKLIRQIVTYRSYTHTKYINLDYD